MKNRLKLCCLLFLIASCKYEDDPLISLVSPPNRIAGYYNVDFVTENGIDQMSRIDTLNITYFLFGTGEAFYSQNIHDFEVRIADTVTYYSDWSFSGNDDKHLVAGTFGCGYPPNAPFPFQPLPGFNGSCTASTVWKITKLSQKKIWLEADYNGNHYNLHLIQFKSAQ